MKSDIIKHRIQQSIYWFLRIFLGLFLLAAGMGKILDVPGYVAVIKTYEMGLPLWARWATAIEIIIIETGLGLWILSGWRMALAGLLSFALHTSYFTLLAITLLRGIDVPNCGCFGVFLARPLELTTLLEDLVLIGFSWGLFVLAQQITKQTTEPSRDNSDINSPAPVECK